MAAIPEINEFTAAVYQIEVNDPVEGGELGISNYQARALANRTLWLKNRADDLETAIEVVSDALDEEVLDRIDAINAILPYLPKKRGYFFSLDIAGDSVGTSYTCGGGFTSAVVTQDGSFTTTVRVTMPGGTFPNTNYKVEIGLQALSGTLDTNSSDIFKPVYKIISATQFDIVFREADTGVSQDLKVHMDVYTLNL